MDSSIKQRLLKLLALSKDGVGGEKQNAEEMLQRALAAHGMNIADLSSEELKTTTVMFRYKNELEKRLVLQILGALGNPEMRYYDPPKRSYIEVDLTGPQKAEVLVKYDVLRKSLEEQIDVFFYGFVLKNHIFPENGKSVDPDDLTPEQRMRARKAQQMAEGIDRAHVQQRLGGY